MGGSGSKEIFRAVLLGLDAAGKTTVLGSMSGKDIPTGPTIEHNFAKISIPRGTIILWDVGGQERQRALWRSVYYGTGCVIFVVDSSDVQRLDLSKDELHSLMHEKELAGVPLLILANKQDAVGALKPEDIQDLQKTSLITDRLVHVMGTCASQKIGIEEVTQWLTKNIQSSKQMCATATPPSETKK